MKKIQHLSFLILGVTVFSCSPKYYSPSTQNVPLISEKGEKSIVLSGNGNQIGLQSAYGLTKNIALQLNGSLFIPADLSNGNGGSGQFGELGVGYYKPVTDNWVFETYGLFAYGGFENHLPSTRDNNPLTSGDISANVIRAGIQPNFGYKSKYFSAAVSSRIVHLSYSNIKGDLVFNNELQTSYLKSNSSNLLVEPALTIKIGFEKIKLQMQYGYSLNATNRNFKQDNSFFTVGVNLNFK